jgi:hypothetical protein
MFKAGTIELLVLSTWKKFKYLSIPDDLYFCEPFFKKKGGIIFSETHMRKLFDEYVDVIFKKVFEPRIANKILAEKGKSIIERINLNTASSDDKKYLKRVFKLSSWNNVSETLSECLSNDISLRYLDINANYNYAKYFALLRYYEALSNKPKKQQKEKYAMWFTKQPSVAYHTNELNDALRDVYEYIKGYCPKSDWRDFKSLFSQNGVTTKIEWTGDATVLNFIFRKLNKVLSFSGGKWEVVDSYFYRKDKNDDSLKPQKLAVNTHHKDEKLENLLKKVSITLGLE